MQSAQIITWNSPSAAAPMPPSKSPRRERITHAGAGGRVKARYESAFTHDGNAKHWALADFLSARAANSKDVRRTLRMRARYEAQNNPSFCGMMQTLANDIIGKGPKLEALTPNDAWNEILEQRWSSWFGETGMIQRLRVCVKSKVIDGEVFLLKKTDASLDDAVKLFLLDIECDQVTTVRPEFQRGYWVDGIELNDLGNPTIYHILKRHPGDIQNVKTPWGPLENDRIPRRFVLHYFRKDRPGQVRGVPEITASLDLFAQLRRFDKAVLTAAEWAATQSAVLETELPADDDTASVGAPWESWELEVGVNTVLPAGYKIHQLKAEQPTASHKDFTRTMTAQAARPLGMPYNLAMCDSAHMNFSSGRLDLLPFHRGVEIERADIEAIILRPAMLAWYDEAVMIPGYLPDDMIRAYPRADLIPSTFHFPRMDSIDPQKDALADQNNLANGTITRAQICGRNGDDWRDVRRQLAREAAFDKELAVEFGLEENWADGNRPNMPTPVEEADADPAGKEAVAA